MTLSFSQSLRYQPRIRFQSKRFQNKQPFQLYVFLGRSVRGSIQLIIIIDNNVRIILFCWLCFIWSINFDVYMNSNVHRSLKFIKFFLFKNTVIFALIKSRSNHNITLTKILFKSCIHGFSRFIDSLNMIATS